MNAFGRTSRLHLASCDARLQKIAHKVLKIKDHSIVQGHRGPLEQDAAFYAGNSKLKWPDGKHNGVPSLALDARSYPWPEDEQEQREEQLYLLGLYKGIASELSIPLRTGADWDRDGEIADNGFDDFFHVEISK